MKASLIVLLFDYCYLLHDSYIKYGIQNVNDKNM